MKFKWTIILTILTPILLLLVFFPMLSGHGTYIPAILLFPFGILSTFLQEKTTIPIILAVLQFPIYGLLLDNLTSKKYKMIIPFLHLSITIFLLIRFFSHN